MRSTAVCSLCILMVAVGSQALAVNPSGLEPFLRSSIIRSELIVVGELTGVNSYKETSGDRSGTIRIDQTLWGKSNDSGSVTVHWIADEWKTTNGGRIRVMDGDTQLDALVGRRILWGLVNECRNTQILGFRCLLSPVCLDDTTSSDLAELANWAENPDTTKEYVAIIQNIFRDLEDREESEAKVSSVVEFLRTEAMDK